MTSMISMFCSFLLLLWILGILLFFNGSAMARSTAMKDRPIGVGVIIGDFKPSETSFVEDSFPSTVIMNLEEQSLGLHHAGGEFFWDISWSFGIKIGLEVLFPKSSGIGSESGENFAVSSRLAIWVESFAIEWNMGFFDTDYSRLNLGTKIGYTQAYLLNEYGEVSGRQAFTEKAKKTKLLAPYELYLNLEFPFLNNYTVSINGGYRLLKLGGFKYTEENFNWATANTKAKGTTVTNNDGSEREFDLSGPFAYASLRIRF